MGEVAGYASRLAGPCSVLKVGSVTFFLLSSADFTWVYIIYVLMYPGDLRAMCGSAPGIDVVITYI